MTELTLERFCYAEAGTFGRVVLPDGQAFYTVERPWLSNRSLVSCIPEGRYGLALDYFNRGRYEAPLIRDVPGRSRILVHVANWPEDLNGCIGLGTSFGVVDGRMGVHSSRIAFARFMAWFKPQLGRGPLHLTIKQYRPHG